MIIVGASNLMVNWLVAPYFNLADMRFSRGDLFFSFGADPYAQVSQVGQVLTILLPTVATGYFSPSGAGVVTSSTFDFTGRTFSARVINNTVGTYAGFMILAGLDNNNYVGIRVYGSTAYFVYRDAGGSPVFVANVAYSPVTTLYWQLVSSGSTITCSYSADGVTWTSLGSQVVAWDITASYLSLEEFNSGVPATWGPGYVQFDKVTIQ